MAKVKKPGILSKEIKLKDLKIKGIKSRKKQAYPTKDTMNLVVHVKNDNSLSRVIPVAIILAILIIIFCKFAVIDRLAAVNQAESRLMESQSMLKNYEKQLEEYDSVREDYYKYTDSYKNAEEAALVERGTVIDVVQNAVGGSGNITSINVSGNTVSVMIYTTNLDQVSTIRQRLESFPNVEDVSVYTANKKDSEGYNHSSIMFEIFDTGDEIIPYDSGDDTEVTEDAE